MFKSILSSLYERVFLAYKTTLIGIALEAAVVAVDVLQAADIPQWAHVLVGIVASGLALYRKPPAPAPQLVP